MEYKDGILFKTEMGNLGAFIKSDPFSLHAYNAVKRFRNFCALSDCAGDDREADGAILGICSFIKGC